MQVQFPEGSGTQVEQRWRGIRGYAVDPVVGMRPMGSMIVRFPMVALDGSDVQAVVKHRDANAFLREAPLPELQDAERVLLLGDSHTDGAVSTADNFATLMEGAATASNTRTAFLNGGCGFYSLWQSVLRACDLIPRYQPKVVVIVVFLGNDFVELDNLKVPHLDDQLRHQPGSENAPPESTSDRQKRMGMIEPYRGLFWQGLNQAMYLAEQPERLAVLTKKSAHAIEHMERVAREHSVRVLWALLPSFDLVFADHARGLGTGAAAVITSGSQRRMRDAFVAELTKRGAAIADLEPAFKADGRATTLYAMDFHVYRHAHQVMAKALAPVIDQLLDR